MLVEDLARNVSAGKQTDFILLDFSKAYDKVNHSKLLWKLHQCGIRGTTLSWICAFPGNWSQMVVLDGKDSVLGRPCFLFTSMTCCLSCHHRYVSMQMTWQYTWQLEVQKMERCYKQTWTDYLCGRSGWTHSSTHLSARWHGWQQPVT